MGEMMPKIRAVAPRETLALLQEFEDDHLIQRALCRDLEAIADALPEVPSPAQVRRVGERIERISTEHYAHALAVLRALPRECRPSESELATLEAMHSLDTSHGEDLVTALWDHVGRSPKRHDGQLGYMLRCYFDGCRRAMAFKEALIGRAIQAALGTINADTRLPEVPAG